MENYIVIRIVKRERCAFTNVLAILSILRSEEVGKKPLPCWT